MEDNPYRAPLCSDGWVPAIKHSVCYLSTPEHVRSFIGRFFYIYTDKGELALGEDSITFAGKRRLAVGNPAEFDREHSRWPLLALGQAAPSRLPRHPISPARDGGDHLADAHGFGGDARMADKPTRRRLAAGFGSSFAWGVHNEQTSESKRLILNRRWTHLQDATSANQSRSRMLTLN